MLARDLGMTVARLRASMSNLEFEDWRNFYRYEAHQREHAANVARAQQEARRGR